MRGTPSSLLKDRSLAVVRSRVASTVASRSLTDVLPTDPVTPITGGSSLVRARRPAAASAATVSATTMAVPSPGGRLVR